MKNQEIIKAEIKGNTFLGQMYKGNKIPKTFVNFKQQQNAIDNLLLQGINCEPFQFWNNERVKLVRIL